MDNKKAIVIMPSTEKVLKEMGDNIRLARLRRGLTTTLVSERAGISRATLWNIEKGSAKVAIGAYAAVLHVLNNLDKDFLMVAGEDEYGRMLQDHKLIQRTKKRRG